MKHLLRKHEALASEYEAEAYGFYEAKHTFSTSPCGEATLHSTNGATSFFIHRRCASFAPQFIQEIIKNAQHKLSIFCIRPKVEIISWSFLGSVYTPKYR